MGSHNWNHNAHEHVNRHIAETESIVNFLKAHSGIFLFFLYQTLLLYFRNIFLFLFYDSVIQLISCRQNNFDPDEAKT